MILEQLTITKNSSYSPNPDGFSGQLRFKSQYGAIELQLTPDLSAKILAVVGANAVEASKQIAQNLSADVFSVPAIESKPAPVSKPDDEEIF